MSLWKILYRSVVAYSRIGENALCFKHSPSCTFFTLSQVGKQEDESVFGRVHNQETGKQESNQAIDEVAQSQNTETKPTIRNSAVISGVSTSISKPVYDKNQLYVVDKALALVKESSNSELDETIEVRFLFILFLSLVDISGLLGLFSVED